MRIEEVWPVFVEISLASFCIGVAHIAVRTIIATTKIVLLCLVVDVWR